MRAKTLTIVISDIKGYTERQSRSSRAEIQAHLLRHHGLLAPIFTAFGGRIVKSMGDAFLVVFESPTDAVLASVQVQQALAVENARTPDPEDALLVRIAISTGEVSVDPSGDVFGEPVNLAARLEGIAEAGTIYLTETTFLSMNRNEIPAFEVGLRVFKGIAGEVKVYRILDEFVSNARVLSIDEIRRIARGATTVVPTTDGTRGGGGAGGRGRAIALVAGALVAGGAGAYVVLRGTTPPAPTTPPAAAADEKDVLEALKLSIPDLVARMANAGPRMKAAYQASFRRRIDDLVTESRWDDAEKAARLVMDAMAGTSGAAGSRDFYFDLVRRDIEAGGVVRRQAHATENPPVWYDTHIQSLYDRAKDLPRYRWMRATWLVATDPARAETLTALEAAVDAAPDALRDAALLDLVRSADAQTVGSLALNGRYVKLRERMEKAAAAPDPTRAMDAAPGMGGVRPGRGMGGG